MSVIPLTLTISLCLVFTFVLFFIREHGRRHLHSAESESLLPLADETPRLAAVPEDGESGSVCKESCACLSCARYAVRRKPASAPKSAV